MKLILALALIALVAGVYGCSEEDCIDCGGFLPPPPRPFLDRSEMWHVLNNVELAYNLRKIANYDALLDENFTFYLTAIDVTNGLPEGWGRETEVSVHAHMFSKETPLDSPRILSLRMDIEWETDPASTRPQPDDTLLTWTESPASGPNHDETWYTTTVFYEYSLTIEVPNQEDDLHYQSTTGVKAQFTVRQDETGKWRLVEMRDIYDPLPPSRVAANINPFTWGWLKVLFL